jgi:hypothetical protein
MNNCGHGIIYARRDKRKSRGSRTLLLQTLSDSIDWIESNLERWTARLLLGLACRRTIILARGRLAPAANVTGSNAVLFDSSLVLKPPRHNLDSMKPFLASFYDC